MNLIRQSNSWHIHIAFVGAGFHACPKDFPKLDMRRILSSSWTPHGSSLQVVVEYAPSRDDPWGVHHCRAVFVENLPASDLMF
ncbi:MAG: hypothetical protein K5778_06210 [Bacteroidaceae bacterium]|nr:hypothetical protein [Bacteroidaceae bacterium]MDO4995400.1 hypothetical protein [Bacteroidales bacterium]